MKTLATGKLFACILFMLLSKSTFAQQDSTLLAHDTQLIKSERMGKGNNSFTLSVHQLENIIYGHTTIKTLETRLGAWRSYGNINQVGADYDNNNVEETLFEVFYDSDSRGKNYTIEADVKKSLKNSIKELRVTTTMNGLQIAQFKKSLQANGYLLNEDLSKILYKLAYQKPSGKPLITIKRNGNGSLTIGISN